MLIIDGHNLIGASPNIKLSDRNAKEKLLDVLNQYQLKTNHKIIVVFDGVGYGGYEITSFENIVINYPSSGQTADDIIINYINQYSTDESVKIISSDKKIIKSAKNNRLTSIDSDNYWTIIKKKID